MKNYYINPDTTHNPHSDNEVHKEGCYFMPGEKIHLGEFEDCIKAVEYARQHGWVRADGCAHCCPEANYSDK